MPHTSVTVFVPAVQGPADSYVGPGVLVDPLLVVLIAGSSAAELVVDQTVRVHLHAPEHDAQLIEGSVLPTDYRDLVLVQLARPVTGLPVEALSPDLVAAQNADAVATVLRRELVEQLPAPSPAQSPAPAVTAAFVSAPSSPVRAGATASPAGKPWWCWISTNGPGCR